MIVGGGFRHGNIDPGPGDLAPFNRVHQILLDNQAPACGVDDDGGRLHAPELGHTEHITG